MRASHAGHCLHRESHGDPENSGASRSLARQRQIGTAGTFSSGSPLSLRCALLPVACLGGGPTCVDAKGKSLDQEFAEACREAVQPDLIATKREYLGEHGDNEGRVACDVTGEMIKFDESHLDHKKPMTFQVLVRTFIASNSIVTSREMLSEPQDQQLPGDSFFRRCWALL